MDELKPCPFCGGEAAHDKWDEERDYSGCSKCDFWTNVRIWNRRPVTVSEGEAEKLLRECREELFRYGEDSACAWEHGDTRSRREAEESRDELYARIEAYLKVKS